MLDVHKISKSFGGLPAVKSLSMKVAEGEIVGLIGPNGAGKSTCFNLVAGSLPVDSGLISFRGQEVTALSQADRARMGLRRSFQIPRLFGRMTVLENLLAVTDQGNVGLGRLFQISGRRARLGRSVSRGMDTLDRFGLAHMADAWAKGLSGGQQKLLTLAMLAISDAPLIMLDEPAAGVNPSMINKLVDHILALNAEGKTIVVVEHNLGFIERVAPRVLVMDAGEKLCEGTMADIRSNPEVQRAYIGGVAAPAARRSEVA